jgi:hypothetical protein
MPELIAHIDAFIANYNEEARPFVWTKSVVHQRRMKPFFAAWDSIMVADKRIGGIRHMVWRNRFLTWACTAMAERFSRPDIQGAIAVCVLPLATLALLATAPVAGDFWWNDAPRHALNGVFIKDFVTAHPLGDPVGWAINYYLRRPALTIMFYPPFFYGIEAAAFALFGVSHLIAQSTVALFVLLLAASVYVFARNVMAPLPAAGAALLAIGIPETAFWARQVMLDIPAYALIVTSACFLVNYLKYAKPRAIYLAAALLLAAIYTKYNAGFVAPAFAIAFVATKGSAFWRDRHALIAAVLAAVGLIPAIVIILKFGTQNLASVSGLQGSLPLNSLACWLFYLEALPGQMGIVVAALAVGGLVLCAKRFLAGQDRRIHGLLLAWSGIGYLFFTLISLKESRDTIMVLMPLVVAAPLLLCAIIPKPFGGIAGFAIGAGTLVYTLTFCPVSRVDGYSQIARYLADNVPRDGVVVYSGYRDANLIFDLAALPGRGDISVIRVDKLLLSAPVGERRRGVTQANYDEAEIATLLHGLGATYFVIQPGFWSDLAVMARFDSVIASNDFEKVAQFDLVGNLSTADGIRGVEILRPTFPLSERPEDIDIDMPLVGRRFQGTTRR